MDKKLIKLEMWQQKAEALIITALQYTEDMSKLASTIYGEAVKVSIVDDRTIVYIRERDGGVLTIDDIKQVKRKIELKDTAEFMCSDDYKYRFKAEYLQTQIRYDKLKRMFDNWDNLEFKPTCPKEIYDIQLKAMRDYLNILEVRAKIEKVSLNC